MINSGIRYIHSNTSVKLSHVPPDHYRGGGLNGPPELHLTNTNYAKRLARPPLTQSTQSNMCGEFIQLNCCLRTHELYSLFRQVLDIHTFTMFAHYNEVENRLKPQIDIAVQRARACFVN